MSEELKPCPFCGGEALFETNQAISSHIEYEAYRVSCWTCGVRTGWHALSEGKKHVIEIWNRRADDEN